MKTLLKWIGRAILILFFTVLAAPTILCLMAFAALFLVFFLTDTRSKTAADALEAMQLKAYIDYAPFYSMTVGDDLTAFTIARYDNHADHTLLRESIMDFVANTPGWQVEAIDAEGYAALLDAHCPGAAFLRPADISFDAWYQSAGALGFFDRDTGLMVCLRPSEEAKPGSIRVNGLSVPHDGYLYEQETHGGFHGDGTTFQALIVPADQRLALEKQLTASADWNPSNISSAEYQRLHQCFYEIPAFFPADTIQFDWWCWVDTYARHYPEKVSERYGSDKFPAVMQAAGAGRSVNWLVALYDADTGLFIFYQYDS